MKVLGIIPARGGSKGILRKNITALSGRPLIFYTINEAKKVDALSRILVSTDDQEIADLAQAHGVEVPFLRSKKHSGDKSKTVDAVIECISRLDEEFDAICLLQPTAPLRSKEDIIQAIELFKNSQADSLVSVTRLEEPHPYKLKKIENGLVQPFITGTSSELPRQSLPPVYSINGAIYLTLTDTLLKKQSFFGDVTIPYIMPPERSVNIDSKLDLLLAEIILKENLRRAL